MLNKNVCPNCGQLYDTDLSKCPLCGTAPQVVDNTGDPVQRKRITEAERKQRRADRKEAELEARRRRKDALFMQDAEEERLIEEEEARRKEEKRRRKEEKRAARRGILEEPREEPDQSPVLPEPQEPVYTPGPAQDGRGPMDPEPVNKDHRRVPRIFLILSAAILLVTLAVGGSYLLWKLELVPISLYDQLAAGQRDKTPEAAPISTGESRQDSASAEAPQTTETQLPEEERVPCTAITLSTQSLKLEAAGDQDRVSAEVEPADTTDILSFTSSDPAVAKVSSVGLVTAVGPGEAIITVSCGEKSSECTVICEFQEDSDPVEVHVDVDELILIKDDMSFFAAGENYVLSVTNVPAGTPVVWKSLDESVCTVDAGGHVVAVGAGTTRVTATVGDLSAECIVRCKFE